MIINMAVVTLWADNFEETVIFYKRVLGMNDVQQESEGIIHFKIDDILFTVMKGKPAKATNSINPRFPIVAFSVEDIQKSFNILKENKVELPWGIEESAAAKWIMFNDPAGNLIELVQFL
jgi:catechol 2,3-dioxygenase-like lactoylglutathione lyase family enzyme